MKIKILIPIYNDWKSVDKLISEIDTKIDLVPRIARERKVEKALSNSFGFGGTNASLVIGKLI